MSQTRSACLMIHGDVIRANAQVADDGTVTILDFDFC
jgi:Ser/Thr protein kinase RdoA (MazF antagonist)